MLACSIFYKNFCLFAYLYFVCKDSTLQRLRNMTFIIFKYMNILCVQVFLYSVVYVCMFTRMYECRFCCYVCVCLYIYVPIKTVYSVWLIVLMPVCSVCLSVLHKIVHCLYLSTV